MDGKLQENFTFLLLLTLDFCFCEDGDGEGGDDDHDDPLSREAFPKKPFCESTEEQRNSVFSEAAVAVVGRLLLEMSKAPSEQLFR
ncbi:unnamed protein product [Gongylonema pulchrum]|uniref:Secreted protein n=1 Tax=Gongylonema pulchrum TaxID=637853 RepID=A0A183E6A8_9BILA|nr:unnamed protein product [Gongylonema pulchrum]